MFFFLLLMVQIVNFKRKEKFQRHFTVWLSIIPRGISKPIFQRRMTAETANSTRKINLSIVVNYCLLSFLDDDQYSNKGYTFWPDLRRAHYVGATLQCQEAGVPF